MGRSLLLELALLYASNVAEVKIITTGFRVKTLFHSFKAQISLADST